MSCFAALSSCRASAEPTFTIFAGCSCTPPFPFVENSTISPRLSPICSTTEAGNVTWFRSRRRAYSRDIAPLTYGDASRNQNFVQSEIQKQLLVRQSIDGISLRRLERRIKGTQHGTDGRNRSSP